MVRTFILIEEHKLACINKIVCIGSFVHYNFLTFGEERAPPPPPPRILCIWCVAYPRLVSLFSSQCCIQSQVQNAFRVFYLSSNRYSLSPALGKGRQQQGTSKTRPHHLPFADTPLHIRNNIVVGIR